MEVRFHKVAALPAILEPNAWYLVENGNYAETYVTNTASVAKMVGNSAMINQLIAAQMTGFSQTYIVADIAARNALTATLNRNAVIQVINATGDSSVASGGATYLWDDANNQSIKVSEFESMDVVTQWNNISGKPTSTPSQIDAAVTNSHTHANKPQIDKIDEDVAGIATYNGDHIKNWNTYNW